MGRSRTKRAHELGDEATGKQGHLYMLTNAGQPTCRETSRWRRGRREKGPGGPSGTSGEGRLGHGGRRGQRYNITRFLAAAHRVLHPLRKNVRVCARPLQRTRSQKAGRQDGGRANCKPGPPARTRARLRLGGMSRTMEKIVWRGSEKVSRVLVRRAGASTCWSVGNRSVGKGDRYKDGWKGQNG